MVARETRLHLFRPLSPPFPATARFGIRVHIKPDSGVELGMKRRRSTASSLSSMKWRRGRGEEALEGSIGSRGCPDLRHAHVSRGEAEDLRESLTLGIRVEGPIQRGTAWAWSASRSTNSSAEI